MKKYAYLLSIAFLACTLVSCTAIRQRIGGAAEPVKPGDKIGVLTVEQGIPTLPYPYLWLFCDYMPAGKEPVSSTADCDVPLMSGVEINFGWLAKETNFAANMDAMTWELSIDGHPVDVEAFEWHEFNYLAHGEDNKARRWLIDLKDLAPGKHTLRLAWKSEVAVDDGFDTYQPGTYEHQVSFTILEEVTYPALTLTSETGQHPYASKKAGLDFLLHLPDEYGTDPQQKWPMLVYLHGAHLRGATLELLMEEPLPRHVEADPQFPFIVVSPLGDGEYEFWAQEELIDSVFLLLAELQDKLSIDPQRIYLSGSDMGGNGVWAIGLRHPEYFAALAPLAGYASFPFEIPKNICDLKEVPVWAFHGERDPYVPLEVEEDLVDALVACGGNARLTVSTHMKNDVPFNVYADPELYTWLAAQVRK